MNYEAAAFVDTVEQRAKALYLEQCRQKAPDRDWWEGAGVKVLWEELIPEQQKDYRQQAYEQICQCGNDIGIIFAHD